MSRRSQKQAQNKTRAKATKRECLLESLGVYEVAEKAPEAALDAAETILAHLLVDEWLRTQGELTEDANIGPSVPNGPDLPEDTDGS